MVDYLADPMVALKVVHSAVLKVDYLADPMGVLKVGYLADLMDALMVVH